MATTALIGIASTITQTLSTLALPYVQTAIDLQNESQKLMNTLSVIRAVLMDLEELKDLSHADQDWLEKLHDILHDADDLVDDFATKTLKNRLVAQRNVIAKVNNFFSTLGFYAVMAKRIRDIRGRLDDMAGDRAKFGLSRQIIVSQARSTEEVHFYVYEPYVVGREDDKKQLVGLLKNTRNEENVSVIPIIGIGGVGKTTLAQIVYNDEEVNRMFEPRMWVSVSEVFDVKAIVQKMLESATQKRFENFDMNQLLTLLGKEISRKRFLLVLDNVWNKNRDDWLNLKGLLLSGARGSQVIVTTRMEVVATICGTAPPYILEGLSEETSWSLFKQVAFKSRADMENPRMVSIGKEMVRKCLGNPLAIRVLGGILFRKSEEEWRRLKDIKLSDIGQSGNKILQILKFSYDHLPSHLKRCFTYCSLFPKGYAMDKNTLINLWIAQGLVPSFYKNQSLEDAGNECFMELLTMSFFQDVKINGLGNVQSCKMHDFLNDLARSVAGAVNAVTDLDGTDIVERTRHISLCSSTNSSWKIPEALLKADRIRTLLLPVQSMSYDRLITKSTCASILACFLCLRALDLHDSGIEVVPDSIKKLQRLRYLDLTKNKLRRLPKSITGLLNLQTLRLSYCGDLERLPKGIKDMASLRHLELDECANLAYMPCGLSKLTSLHTLTMFIVGKGDDSAVHAGLHELNSLNYIQGELRITNLGCGRGAARAEDKILKGKEFLQSLRLEWNQEANDGRDDEVLLDSLQPHSSLKNLFITRYQGAKFPLWMMAQLPLSLTDLVELTIRDCPNCQQLPPFYQLQRLKILRLSNLSSVEHIDDNDSKESTIFFPSLRELHLNNLPNLKEWWARNISGAAATGSTLSMVKPSFPCLSKTTIEFCTNLASLPLQMHVEELSFHRASEKLLRQQLTAMAESLSAASSSSLSHSKLKSLYILGVKDMDYLSEEGLQQLASLEYLDISWCSRLLCLPDEGLRGLKSLQFLRIRRCSMLNSLSSGIQHLTALHTLRISDCKELVFSEDSLQFQGLSNLTSLSLDYLPKLEELPIGLKHVTTLQSLNIETCFNLKALPEWIGNLTLLEDFRISDCPNITCLPEEMHSLANLKELVIVECENLLDRCQRDTGEDRLKIAHVPKVVLQRRT
ncbi:UNVERIFIED_CONTAM: putative disease resistance protein RGA1 [Sesamum radiatum]|uniref:Disease resistance protein RGA1 n=1 Tax=Sesamum radiatum TaxID=300843 RepID=A0AAW2VBV3_SESRA